MTTISNIGTLAATAALMLSTANACTLSADAPARWQVQNLTAVLQSMVDGKRITGAAVAITSPQGDCFVGVGDSGLSARPGLRADSMFEIGSITKGFTGLLLADMVARGEIGIDDAIGPQLPAALRTNQRLAAVTYRQLTTHTSGMPRIPITQAAFLKSYADNPADPYKAYSRADFEAYLLELKPKPSAKSEYSNSGMALLGIVLAQRLGLSYEVAIAQRLLTPAGLSDVTFKLTPEQAARMVQGHNDKLAPTVAWNTEVFVPTGGLRATPQALVQVAKQMMSGIEPWKTAQTPLFALSNPAPSGSVAYGWHIARRAALQPNGPVRELVWHNGGTFGASSFLGVDTQAKFGVVVLVNTGAARAADEIALHLWDSAAPPPKTTSASAWDNVKTRVAGWFGIKTA